MPWFMSLFGVLALALTTEITGHTEAKRLGGLGVLGGEHVVAPGHLLKPMSSQSKQVVVGRALEAVLDAAAERLPGNEASPCHLAGSSLGGLRRSFVTVHARIALVLDARLPPSVSGPALEEAAVIWAPYDVTVAPPEAPAPCPLPGMLDAVLTVHIDDTTVGTGVWSGPFASIRFLDGVPETTIRLHYANLTRLGLATIVLDGAHEPQWPRTLRDRVLARMIGRVLAHEIGHWLLRTRGHSATGLMRAVQGVGELAEPHRVGFRLAPGDVVRLRETIPKS